MELRPINLTAMWGVLIINNISGCLLLLTPPVCQLPNAICGSEGIYMFRRLNILVDKMAERRTTILLEKEVYDALVKESVDEYNSSKAISKVINKILKRSLINRDRLRQLLYSKPVAKVTQKQFERFRRGLSKSVHS